MDETTVTRENNDSESTGLLANSLGWIVLAVAAAPRLALISAAKLTILALLATLVLLEFQTRRSDLIDPTADFHRRWLMFVEKFPDTADLVVVVRGSDRVSVQVTLEQLGRLVEEQSDLFRSVLFRIDRPGGGPTTYVTTVDGHTGYLRASPVVTGTAGFEGATAAISRMRELIADVRADNRRSGNGNAAVQIGLTGIPVLESDEMIRSREDMIYASLLAAIGVAVLMGVGFHGLRLPLVILVSLGMSLIWSFGLTSLTIGHLNILSVSFAVVLIGLGVDFSIHFLARYVRLRQEGRDLREALGGSARGVGPGILTAAVTTALAFLCASLTEFRGVAELGWIAGAGIGLCAVVTFCVLPAMIRLTDSRLTPVDFAVPLMGERWRHRVAENPRAFLLVSLAILAISGSALVERREGQLTWRVRYDYNLLNLQAEDLDSVAVQRRVARDPDGGALFAVSLARSLEEAESVAKKMEALPSVGRVMHLGRFLPGADRRGLEQLSPALVSRYLSSTGDWLVQVSPRESIWEQEPLGRFVKEIRGVDPEATGTPLQNYEAGRQIKESYEQAAIAALGAIVVVLLAAGLGGWRALVMLAVAGAVISLSIEMSLREGLGRFPVLWSAAFVAASVLSGLILDWRSLRDTLLALLPPVFGAVLMLGVMQWLKVPLNPANLIVLPLVLGIGVDDGVHVLHDFRSRRGPYVMSPSTIHGVLLTSLTSMIGFGTLMVASHRGLSSLGLVLLLGVGSCLLVALVPLPAILRLVSREKVNRPAAD
ncbi:MAG: hypothetical protein CMJ65_10760 [Planctomycetaceae bacterium]|nr:hypothetical protein [Planctomycetaceae bacterium]